MSPTLPTALTMALDDEYRARATYQAVLARFGPVPPFSNIVQAEQRHIDALLPLFARYGIVPPADRWTGQVAPPPTLLQACEAGVAGEIRNYQMYDQLLTQIAEPDVRAVFTSLRNASAYNHLPAFQACAARESSVPAVRNSTYTPPAKAYLASETLPLWLGVALGGGLVWWLSRRRTEA
jgi:hypothetical protein